MPAIMIERPKMTRTMYQALKRHIMKERERKKQEQAQDEELERQRKEQELRKKKEVEDSLTLEQTKEQITQLESKLESMKQDKHGLFSQLKKVLHQEDESRKRAQEKEHNEMVATMQQQQAQYAAAGLPPPAGSGGGAGSSGSSTSTSGQQSQQHMYLPPPPSQMSKYMNVSQIQQQRALYAGQKRNRSPSPPPVSHTSAYQYPPGKYQGAAPKKAYASAKASAAYQVATTHSSYPPSQSAGHTYGQTPGLYPQPGGASAKYAPGQSAFSSYPTHYAHQQQIKEAAAAAHQYPPQQFPVSRLAAAHQAAATATQPPVRGYMSAGHSAMPLQQQIEHANKKSGFAEDKYKLDSRSMQMLGLHQPHTGPPGGSISSGFPIRSQASNSSAYPPQPSQSVVSSSQHHAYAQAQAQQRYYQR